LTGVQLHFDAGFDSPKKLREQFGSGLRILRVLHYGVGIGDLAARVLADSYIDALLIDSRTAEARGGTGIAYDWESAATSLSNSLQHHHRLVVAGGLTPANVAEAIATLHPWGVDVVSGVEASRGRKDAEKVKSFVALARAAATLQERDR
jgi:phosphoribosylanthranilate isomerase